MTFQRGVAPDDPQRIPGFLKKELEKIQRAFSAISASWATLTGKPANLTALEALVGAAGQVPYFTGLGALALASLTPYARTLIACANAPAVDAVLGLGPLAVLASPNDATKFLNGAASPAFVAVKGSDLSMADVATNNVSIAAHGFAPKAPNDGTKFLNGLGVYAVPASGALAALPAFPAITGIKVALSADRSTITRANGNLVSLVSDISGNGHDASAAGTARPFYHPTRFNGIRPSLNFDGVAAVLQTINVVTLAQPFTVVCVFEGWQLGSGNAQLWQGTASLPEMFTDGTASQWEFFCSTTILTSTTLMTTARQGAPPGQNTTPQIQIAIGNGASSLISGNGLDVTGTTGTSGWTTAIKIGGPTAKCSIYEFLLIDHALTLAERTLINAYYAAALQLTL